MISREGSLKLCYPYPKWNASELRPAKLRLARGGRTFPYDMRPSDGIALAVRTDADIFVSEDVMEKAGRKMDDQVEDHRELALKRFEEEEERE